MADQQVTSGFVVAVDGVGLPEELYPLLVSGYVDGSRDLPDAFVLRYRDPDRTLLARAGVRIGSRLDVEVAPATGNAPVPLVSGEVTAVETEFDATGTFTVVRGYDPAHRLFRGRRTDTYTQVTASDVVTAVARRAGIPLGRVDATPTVFEHVTQAAASDWEFLDALARETGHEVTVRDGRLDFHPPRPAADAPAPGGSPGPGEDPLVLRQGADLLRFRAVVTSAEQVGQVEVRGWDVGQKQALVATAPARTRSAELPDVTPAQLAEVFGNLTYTGTAVPYRTQAEVDAAAAATAEQIAGAFAELEGVARGNPRIRAGVAVSLVGVGSPFDGKYVVTRSRHQVDPYGGYTTRFAVTGRQERSLFGLASGLGGRAARRLAGVVVAQVSDVRDPQRLGRVRLTFPWLSDGYVSDWARTVQPGAGRDRGALVLPEVGDEVLVAFEHGDVRRPYVVGGLHNGVDTPPEGEGPLADEGSGAVNRRSFVSRTGQRVDLLDEEGARQGLSLRTGDGTISLVLDATGTELSLRSDGTVRIEGARGIALDAGSGTLELRGARVELAATDGVDVDAGTGSASVSAAGELALTGGTARLEGTARATVRGGQSCDVSAALVRIN